MAAPTIRGVVDKQQPKFAYCELCRHSHDMGKRHAFSRRHREKVKVVLAKFAAKVKLAKQDMKAPCIVAGSFETEAKFWCYMCASEVNKHVSNEQLTVRHAGFIEHLMSTEHAQRVERFWRTNRIETALQARFIFSGRAGQEDYQKAVEIALANHEEKEKLVISQSAAEIRRVESNRVQLLPRPECTVTMPSPCQMVAASKVSSDVTSKSSWCPAVGTSVNPSGSRMDGREVGVASGLAVSDWLDESHPPTRACSKAPNAAGSRAGQFQATSQPPLRPGPLSRVQTIGVISSGGLTALNIKVGRSAGNIHSGVLPPWLRRGNEEGEEEEAEAAKSQEVGPTEADFLKHLEQQRKSKLNPSRVGADFDRSTPSTSQGEWLPSFGRVWNSGRRLQSRHQYRKEAGQMKRKKGSWPTPSTARQPP